MNKHSGKCDENEREIDCRTCHIWEWQDLIDDFDCLDYMECEECPYYYEDDD